MYHRVDGGFYDPFSIRASPERFRDQMEWLRSRYQIASLAEIVASAQQGAIEPGFAAVTFDDAYESVFTVARPILEELKIPATIFFTGHFLGRRPFWWERLADILQRADRLRCGDMHPSTITDGATILPARGGLLATLRAKLLPMPSAEREGALDRLESDHGLPPARPRAGPMTPAQARRIDGTLFDIGAHTLTHPDLTLLSDEEARVEISGSRAALETFCGRAVQLFCYPFGAHDERIRQIAAEAGVSAALAVEDRCLEAREDVFALPRVDPGDRSSVALEARVAALEAKAEISKRPVVAHPSAKPDAEPAFDFGDFASTKPASSSYGYDRGEPIDRHYIEAFLDRHRYDISGRVLEVKNRTYATRFGHAGSVCDVLDIDPANAAATIVDDLQIGEKIPSDTYDCIILTQVLQLVYDLPAAMRTLHRVLKPGGVLLVTVGGITAANQQPWYWSFHPAAVRRLLESFDRRSLIVEGHGNVGSAAAFLMGLAQHELPAGMLDARDEQYTILVTARAVKSPVATGVAWPELPMPNDPPLISVLMALRNAEQTVGAAIDSVLRQTVSDWELVVVDDRSEDSSRDRVAAYAERYPDRVRLVRAPARVGASGARNIALSYAAGEFICFFDSDDILHPRKLEHDLSVFSRFPEIGAVAGPALWWWEDGSSPARVDRIFGSGRVLLPPAFSLATYVRKEGEPPCPHALMYRRRALADIGGFDRALHTYEDQKLTADFGFRHALYVSPHCLVEYRRSERSLWSTSRRDGSGSESRGRFHKWLVAAAQAGNANELVPGAPAELDPAIFERLFKRYRRTLGDVTALEPLPGGVRNTCHLVHAGGGKRFVVKTYWQSNGLDCAVEAAALQRLAAANVAVARIAPSDRGKLFEAWSGRSSLMLEFIDGKTPLAGGATLFTIGRLMAQIHAVPPGEITRRHYADLRRLNELRHTAPDSHRALIARAAEAVLPVDGLALPKVLSHTDLHRWNLLALDQQIFAIDFEHAALEPRPFDLARAILFSHEDGDCFDREIADAVLSGYASGQLSSEERSALPIYMVLACAHWLLSELSKPEAETVRREPARIAQLLETLLSALRTPPSL